VEGREDQSISVTRSWVCHYSRFFSRFFSRLSLSALAYFANGQFLFCKITLRFFMSNSDR
jgi:hypothetical protein